MNRFPNVNVKRFYDRTSTKEINQINSRFRRTDVSFPKASFAIAIDQSMLSSEVQVDFKLQSKCYKGQSHLSVVVFMHGTGQTKANVPFRPRYLLSVLPFNQHADLPPTVRSNCNNRHLVSGILSNTRARWHDTCSLASKHAKTRYRGLARTQVPTTRNYTLELPTFGVIARVNPIEVQ